MFPYLNTVDGFLEDCKEKRIVSKLSDAMTNIMGNDGSGDKSREEEAWKNSIEEAMRCVICKAKNEGLPGGAIVALEATLEVGGQNKENKSSDRRTDFIIAGGNKIIVVELKQWSHIIGVKNKSSDSIYPKVRFYDEYISKQQKHPAVQAWKYVNLLKKYNENVKNNELEVMPCVYLHNMEEDYILSSNDIDTGNEARKEKGLKEVNKESLYWNASQKSIYEKALGAVAEKGFSKDEDDKTYFKEHTYYKDKESGFAKFIADTIKGDGIDTIKKLKEGMPGANIVLHERISDIESLSENSSSEFGPFKMEREDGVVAVQKQETDEPLFLLRGDQRYCLATLMTAVDELDRNKEYKMVFFIKGAAGSGKTLIALLLQQYCKKKNLECFYGYTRRAMEVYESKQNLKWPRDYIDKLFNQEAYKNEDYKVVICDESNGNRKNKTPISDIASSANIVIVFYDADQAIYDADFLSRKMGKEIKSVKEKYGEHGVTELSLVSQFRCGMDDGYASYIKRVLQIVDEDSGGLLDFIPKDIKKYTKGKTEGELEDGVQVYYGEFGKNEDGDKLNTITEIHGLEVEKLAVVMTNNIRYNDKTGEVEIYDGGKKIAGDAAMYKKNTYHVLLTRALKEIYIYCEDDKLRQRFIDCLPEEIQTRFND